VNTNMLRDGPDDLHCERRLMFADALFRDEEMAIHVSAKARQDVTAIPSQATSHLVRDLADKILPFRFRVSCCNVKEERAPWAIWFAEVLMPAQGTQILWPQGQREYDVDRNRDLGLDEANAIPLQVFGDNPHQLLGQEKELGAKAIRL